MKDLEQRWGLNIKKGTPSPRLIHSPSSYPKVFGGDRAMDHSEHHSNAEVTLLRLVLPEAVCQRDVQLLRFRLLIPSPLSADWAASALVDRAK